MAERPDPGNPALTKRTVARRERAAREAALPGSSEAEALNAASTPEAKSAARLAQVVNLHIAGFSLAEIGAAIGASAQEVDRMLAQDASRYVRSQPQLRVYVRNWLSEKYTAMLDANWEQATDKNHPAKLENQDRALRILDSMRKLHGADAPVQAEVKVEAAPEAVEQLVNALAAREGLAYDTDIFDVVDAEVVHDAHEQAVSELGESSDRIDRDADDRDADDGDSGGDTDE